MFWNTDLEKIKLFLTPSTIFHGKYRNYIYIYVRITMVSWTSPVSRLWFFKLEKNWEIPTEQFEHVDRSVNVLLNFARKVDKTVWYSKYTKILRINRVSLIEIKIYVPSNIILPITLKHTINIAYNNFNGRKEYHETVVYFFQNCFLYFVENCVISTPIILQCWNVADSYRGHEGDCPEQVLPSELRSLLVNSLLVSFSNFRAAPGPNSLREARVIEFCRY